MKHRLAQAFTSTAQEPTRSLDAPRETHQFNTYCGLRDVARATGYSYRQVVRFERAGRLKSLRHPHPIGNRIYSGLKLAAIKRDEIPGERRFFGSASRHREAV